LIVLDTHIWIWWIHGDPMLPAPISALLDSAEQTGIGVSAISCWEVSKLVKRRRLFLPCPVVDWIRRLRIRVSDCSTFHRACVSSPRNFLVHFTATQRTKSSWRRRGFLMRLSSRSTPRSWHILMFGSHQSAPTQIRSRPGGSGTIFRVLRLRSEP